MLLHNICTSPYFDFIITAVICVNVITMSIEFYMMPSVNNNNNIKFLIKINLLFNFFKYLEDILEIINYLFTFLFLIEAIMRIIAFGFVRYIREKYK